MLEIIKEIHKLTFKATDLVAKKSKSIDSVTEDNLDLLAESIELLNDLYETLYDNVFVSTEEE